MRARAGVVATAVVVGLAAAGCGGLPLPGGVRVERTVAAGGEDPDAGNVRVVPPQPAEGACPQEIVQGFLNAQADAEDGYGIAQEFLAPGVAWNTAGPVSVYASATVSAASAATGTTPPGSGAGTASRAATTCGTTATTATVGVVLSRTASLDAAGTYVPRADQVSDTFRLAQVGGQWRILTPPSGLQLTAGDLTRSYLPSTLWWFSPDLQTLVPEIRWLPEVTAGRQTQLVRALLAGPSAALAGAVRTAAPSGVVLDTSVTDVGSDVVVDLSQQAASLSPGALRLLLLQLAATLAPGSTGTAVRLEVAGQPLPSSLAPQRLALTQVTAYDPDAADPQAPSVALVGGRITAVAGSAALPTTATQSLAGRDLRVAVPQPRGGGIAAVQRTGRGAEQLVVAPASGGVQTVGAAAALGSDGTPSWSEAGTLVVPTATGLLVRSAAGTVAVVRTPAGLGAVTSVRLARDGVRLLVTAGGGAYVTTLTSGSGGPVLGAFQSVGTGLGAVQDGAWESATSLALVVRTATGGLALEELAVDGSQTQRTALPPSVGTTGVTLAAAPGVPVLVGGGGTIAQLVGEGWRALSVRGTAPAAPG